jgi:peptidyl-prolyl cis-trans isomerase D
VQNFPVDAVQKAAFALAKGSTSDVIDAGYAFLVLHVDDKQTAHLKSLDEVKSQIESVAKLQKTTNAAESLANTLLSSAKANGLEKAAAAKGLQVITTDFIGRTDSLPGIGTSPQLVNAIFGADEKAPPEEVQVPQGFAIFEMVAVQPPSTPGFDQIRSRVEGEFKNERAASLLSQKTQELSDRAKASHDLKKAAKEVGATVKTSDFVLPDGQVPDVGSMQGQAAVAFTMKPGEISGPIATGSNGIVIAMVEKQQPSPEDYAAKKDETRDTLLQKKQAEIFEVFASNLRDQRQKAGKVKINQDEMKKLTGTPAGQEGGE